MRDIGCGLAEGDWWLEIGWMDKDSKHVLVGRCGWLMTELVGWE